MTRVADFVLSLSFDFVCRFLPCSESVVVVVVVVNTSKILMLPFSFWVSVILLEALSKLLWD